MNYSVVQNPRLQGFLFPFYFCYYSFNLTSLNMTLGTLLLAYFHIIPDAYGKKE